MEVHTTAGRTTFAFAHSASYRSIELKFFDAVRSMNPDNFSILLRMQPYHVNSLLQLSDVFKINGDMQTAHDFVERAIFCLETHSHHLFNPSAGSTLDYKVYENRAYFLALFRHVLFLSQRGCWRTALECCKFLLSLHPDDDPTCALLLVDYLSLRSGEYAFLERLHSEWRVSRHLDWLPNISLSVALLHYFRHRENPTTVKRQHADDLLVEALIHFPEFPNILCDKIEARMKPEVATHPFFSVAPTLANGSLRSVRMLVSLYVERTHTLWKPADVLEWLQVCVE